MKWKETKRNETKRNETKCGDRRTRTRTRRGTRQTRLPKKPRSLPKGQIWWLVERRSRDATKWHTHTRRLVFFLPPPPHSPAHRTRRRENPVKTKWKPVPDLELRCPHENPIKNNRTRQSCHSLLTDLFLPLKLQHRSSFVLLKKKKEKKRKEKKRKRTEIDVIFFYSNRRDDSLVRVRFARIDRVSRWLAGHVGSWLVLAGPMVGLPTAAVSRGRAPRRPGVGVAGVGFGVAGAAAGLLRQPPARRPGARGRRHPGQFLLNFLIIRYHTTLRYHRFQWFGYTMQYHNSFVSFIRYFSFLVIIMVSISIFHFFPHFFGCY